MKNEPLPPLTQMGTRFRHLKTGGIYRIVAAGWLEADLTACVVYEREGSGHVFIRPQAEFNDGRFEDIS